MNSAALFCQLKSFCYNIEQDAKKIRRSVENEKNYEISMNSTDEFVSNLSLRVSILQTEKDKNEKLIYGENPEVFRMTTAEIFDKCFNLHEENRKKLIRIKEFARSRGIETGNMINDENENIENVPVRNDTNKYICRHYKDRPVLQELPINLLDHIEQNEKVDFEVDYLESDPSILKKYPEKSLFLHESFHSPDKNNSNSQIHSDDFSLTPTLQPWKLSAVTRNYFNDNIDQNHLIQSNFTMTNVEVDNLIEKMQKLEPTDIKNQKENRFKIKDHNVTTPDTPIGILETDLSHHYYRNDHKSISYHSNVQLTEDNIDYGTPPTYPKKKTGNVPYSTPLTPPTPSLLTPFRTSHYNLSHPPSTDSNNIQS